MSKKFIIFHYYSITLNVRSLIIFCLCSGDIYLSLGISLSCLFLIVSEYICGKLYEIFVISLPIKSPVVPAAFWYFIIIFFYINLSSSIISCHFSEESYLSLGVSLLFLFIIVSELFSVSVFETFVILLAILLPIKSPVAAAIFELLFWKHF